MFIRIALTLTLRRLICIDADSGVLPSHSAPTGARNSSLGHPNMAEASLGKNFPKVIPSLLHVFSG